MKTTTKTLIAIAVVALAIVIIILAIRAKPAQNHAPYQAASEAVSFAWKYGDGGEDLDGLPKTQVFLEVGYENGKIVSQKVDEVQGSCNAIDPQKEDTDRVTGTTKIQCYAAGFGEYYKIVKGINTYEVRRKHIEEGVPEVPPTEFKYETVAEFPLMQ
jgi:hypothetical protein